MRFVTTKEMQTKIYLHNKKMIFIHGEWLDTGYLELRTVFDDQMYHRKYMDYSFNEAVELFKLYILNEAKYGY